MKRTLLSLFVIVIGLGWYWIDGQSKFFQKEKVFTKDELKLHGPDSTSTYVAICGKVYDVDNEKGGKFYKNGGSYSFFSGIDGSKAFINGDFTEEGLIDDVSSLSPTQTLELIEWQQFYDKEYKYLGKLEGYFYDIKGFSSFFSSFFLSFFFSLLFFSFLFFSFLYYFILYYFILLFIIIYDIIYLLIIKY